MHDLDEFLDAWLAAERLCDADTTEGLLTDDFVGIGPVDFQLPKSAWLQRLESGDLRYDRLDLSEVTTRTYGSCAVTTARCNATGAAQGHPLPEATRITLVTIQDSGEWRLANVQHSFIAGTPGAPGAPGS